MLKMLKARKGGFTLVELLIVMMIISILSGMMMLTMGSATDLAEATKIISDIRTLKSAVLMYAISNSNQWPDDTWDDAGGTANGLPSLDRYLDKPIFTTSSLKIATGVNVATGTNSISRDLIGLHFNTAISAGVGAKLRDSQADAGLYNESGALYPGTGDVYMILR